jgi:hypothetical protein
VSRIHRIIIGFTVVVVSILTVFFHAKTNSFFTPDNHVDGAYQTFVSLLRYSSLDAPGRDFVPYIGIGTVLPLLPIFIFFGRTIGASEFAAHFSVPLIVCLQFFLASKIVWKFSYLKSVLCSTIPLIIVLSPNLIPFTKLSEFLGQSTFTIALDPGGSLRPIRAFFPYLCLCVVACWRNSPKRCAVVLGIVAPLAPNDFAFSTVIALSAFYLLSLIVRKANPRQLVSSFVSIAGVFVATYIFAVLVLTAFHPFSLLRYNFVDVPSFQSWYFGPWASNTRIYRVEDLLRLLLEERCLIPLVVLITISAFALKKRSFEMGLWAFVGWSLFLGAVVATVGGHFGGYLISFHLWFITSVVLSLVRIVFRSFRDFASCKILLSWSLVVCLFIQMIDEAKYMNLLNTKIENSTFVWKDDLGSYINPAYLPAELIGLNSNLDFVEEYSGLITAFRRKPQLGRVDSVIHALGSERTAAEKVMSEIPSAVISSSPHIGDWFGWSFSANWWFHRVLLQNYDPKILTPSTILWKPASSRIWPTVPCTIDNLRHEISLHSQSDGLYELTLDTSEFSLGFNEFLMVQNNINHAADSNGYIAIDPNGETSTIPVYLHRSIDNTRKIDFKLVSNDSNDSIPVIKRCSARSIVVPSNVSSLVYQDFGVADTPYLWTDSNWDRGVGRLFPHILLINNLANREQYRDVSAIVFNGSMLRKVESVIIDDEYIRIILSGNLLQPRFVGFPNEFKVIKKKYALK